MKRILSILFCALLLLSLTAIPACAYDYQSQTAIATDKLSLRDGPGTNYASLGTYNVKGQAITLTAKAWDSANSIYWVRCQFKYKGKTINGWTGAKRFDGYSYDLDCLPTYGSESDSYLYYTDDGSQWALATAKLSLRGGPGTSFKDLGTYNVKGEYIELTAKAWDSANSIYWVKCTFNYKGKTIVGWTGAQRFDGSSYDIEGLPYQ